MQSPQTKTSTSFGPQRPKQVGSPSTGMILSRKAHSPMRRHRRSCGKLSGSNLESSMTQRAEVSAVMGRAEGPHRQVQCRACEASAGGAAEGDQWQQAHLMRATSTTTARVEDELMKMVSRMHGRSSQALESRQTALRRCVRRR